VTISVISQSILQESKLKIQKEIDDISHTLSPLIAQRNELDDKIQALEGRKSNLIKNSSDIDNDAKGI